MSCWSSSSSSPACRVRRCPFVARRLGLVDDESAQDVEVEVAPLDKISADLLQVRIPAKSRLVGVEVGELRLPKDTVVSLIIRDERPFFPDGRERIQAGDELLIVTPEDQRLNTEERLRAVGQRGRWARPRGAPSVMVDERDRRQVRGTW